MALAHSDITARLANLSGWHLRGNEIEKSFVLKDFIDGLSFVTRVGFVAERLGHHPDITLAYNRVTLRLSTHDAGGLTEADFTVAAAVDALSLQ